MARFAKKPKRIGRPSPRENNERFHHTGSSDVILIGYQTPEDAFSLMETFLWLRTNRNQPEWLDRLGNAMDFDSYNMGTHPETTCKFVNVSGDTTKSREKRESNETQIEV
jgi:hypothetical protein